jgi:hypothetical protein
MSSVHTSAQTLDIEILMYPQDSKGRTIEASGNLDAKLWRQTGSSKKGELLNEWTGIQVIPESYEQNSGARIWLQYSRDYEDYPAFLQPGDLDMYCGSPVHYDLFILEIAFTLDGKTLVCTKTDLCMFIVLND